MYLELLPVTWVEVNVADGLEEEARLIIPRANMKDAVSEIFTRCDVADLTRADEDGVDRELDFNERDENSADEII